MLITNYLIYHQVGPDEWELRREECDRKSNLDTEILNLLDRRISDSVSCAGLELHSFILNDIESMTNYYFNR